MAVDEVLLNSAASGGQPTLRFYQWNEPTLSLGYFQEHSARESHRASQPLPIVRRSTGGGALVHDAELTYSLALPPKHPFVADATALTCLAHRSLIKAIADLGGQSDALTTCAAAIPAQETGEPFLCFLRRAEGDLLANDPDRNSRSENPDGLHKVCGSAQRRRRGALLQHGGALLARSAGAPELLGLTDLGVLPPDTPRERLQEAWARHLAESLEWGDLVPGRLTEAERSAADSLAADRFSADTWTRRR